MGFSPCVSFLTAEIRPPALKGALVVDPNAALKGRPSTSLPATLELSRFKLLLSIRNGKREQKLDPPHAVTWKSGTSGPRKRVSTRKRVSERHGL